MVIKCSQCGRETEYEGNPFRPFCSERCKLLDLGVWLSGAYRIPIKSQHEDEHGESIPKTEPEKE
jgi:uncharacterized protein